MGRGNFATTRNPFRRGDFAWYLFTADIYGNCSPIWWRISFFAVCSSDGGTNIGYGLLYEALLFSIFTVKRMKRSFCHGQLFRPPFSFD
jgi:hypothetical protein